MTDDFFIIQNPALGGAVLWAFTEAYTQQAPGGKLPVLPLLLPVLPLVFHENSRQAIERRNLQGGLFRALSDDRTLPKGLDERMRAMSGLTLLAFRTACAAELLEYLPATAEVRSLRRSAPREFKQGISNQMVGAAKRLGTWFAGLSPAHVSVLLSIRF